MSQQDNFSGGFLVGAIVGGIVGGIVGAVVASRNQNNADDTSLLPAERLDSKNGKGKKRPLRAANSNNIELARRSLEDKIAQLNDAIDDVRQQLSTVNENASEPKAVDSLTEDL
jgi:uncharacterized membrane protein